MKKLIFIIFSFFFCINNINALELTEYSESAILMESSTGNILFEKDAKEKRPPASMTKIMSMIIVMDAINDGKLSLDSDVLISENSSSMGGSQVYLNTGEVYKVKDLLKGVAIASANDAVVALSEKVAGTEEEFVKLMNDKCKELGCVNTNFVNSHGLDNESHYSTAYDMAIMARYLLNTYPMITEYTNIYEDYLKRSDGSSSWLVNTNKLVRFYEDVDGLKTGYTKDAGYCLTATAKKNNMRLISVVMKVDSETHRTSDTVKLLNYGFSNYKLNMIFKKGTVVDKIKIDNSKNEYINVVLKDNAFDLINVNDNNKDYSYNIKLNKITLPIKKNSIIGKLEIIDNEGNTLNNVNLIVKEDILKANIFDYIKRNIRELVNGKKLI